MVTAARTRQIQSSGADSSMARVDMFVVDNPEEPLTVPTTCQGWTRVRRRQGNGASQTIGRTDRPERSVGPRTWRPGKTALCRDRDGRWNYPDYGPIAAWRQLIPSRPEATCAFCCPHFSIWMQAAVVRAASRRIDASYRTTSCGATLGHIPRGCGREGKTHVLHNEDPVHRRNLKAPELDDFVANFPPLQYPLPPLHECRCLQGSLRAGCLAFAGRELRPPAWPPPFPSLPIAVCVSAVPSACRPARGRDLIVSGFQSDLRRKARYHSESGPRASSTA